jgi:hypothetical protein
MVTPVDYFSSGRVPFFHDITDTNLYLKIRSAAWSQNLKKSNACVFLATLERLDDPKAIAARRQKVSFRITAQPSI